MEPPDRLRGDGDDADPELPQGADDADCDLASVCDQTSQRADRPRILPDGEPPDQLTVARAPRAVVVVLFAWDFPNHAYWATAVFVVAMATDQVEPLASAPPQPGRWRSAGCFDPIADKVLVLAALVMLIGEGVAPAWMIALIVVREILVSGLRLAAVERGVVLGARDLGRAKTWAQAVAATIAGLAAAGAWSEDIAWWALLAALVATWVSGLDYARVAPRVLRGENA